MSNILSSVITPLYSYAYRKSIV